MHISQKFKEGSVHTNNLGEKYRVTNFIGCSEVYI